MLIIFKFLFNEVMQWIYCIFGILNLDIVIVIVWGQEFLKVMNTLASYRLNCKTLTHLTHNNVL
jgi:hypothetical protein